MSWGSLHGDVVALPGAGVSNRPPSGPFATILNQCSDNGR